MVRRLGYCTRVAIALSFSLIRNYGFRAFGFTYVRGDQFGHHRKSFGGWDVVKFSGFTLLVMVMMHVHDRLGDTILYS